MTCRNRFVPTLVVLGVLFVACSTSGDVTLPNSSSSPISAPSPRSTVGADWTTCTNDRFAYSLSYPSAWFTTHNIPENACRWFDPKEFRVETDSEGPVTALSVKDESQVSFEDASKGEGDSGTRYLRNERTTVSGRTAVIFETVLEEEVMHPRGTRTYGYVIDRSGRAFLVFTTHLPGSTAPYDENKRIVDQAVQTVTFATV